VNLIYLSNKIFISTQKGLQNSDGGNKNRQGYSLTIFVPGMLPMIFQFKPHWGESNTDISATIFRKGINIKTIKHTRIPILRERLHNGKFNGRNLLLSVGDKYNLQNIAKKAIIRIGMDQFFSIHPGVEVF
jgi:hypothetical protein